VLNNVRTEHFNWLILVSILLFFIEMSLSSGGFIFFIFISSICIYIGRKRMKKDLGKFWFWLGIVILILTIINMSTFKILLIVLLVYIVMEFRKSKRSPNLIQPEIIVGEIEIEEEPILKKEKLLENYLFGLQKTPDHVYEWNDINIVSGIGDTIIDLSNTVLPQGESVIVIRHFIGKVQILIPYEVEVSILHSAIVGRATIFQHEEKKPFNQILSFHTPDYEFTQQKIKIVTSIISGDIEVKRI
jgi:lia operon protein LiaF